MHVSTSHPVAALPRPDACVCTTLKKASRTASQLYDRALERSGLTTAQFSLLVALYYRPRCPVTKLAAHLVMERTTLTRNLEPLERRGLIMVEGDPADGRKKVVSLTPKGEELVFAALPLWQSVQSKMIASLGEEEWDELRQLLRRSIAAGQENLGQRSEERA